MSDRLQAVHAQFRREGKLDHDLDWRRWMLFALWTGVERRAAWEKHWLPVPGML